MHCGDGAISVVTRWDARASWEATRAAQEAAAKRAAQAAARKAAAEWAAAKRRAELVGRGNELSAELSTVAGHWQAAKEEHGADFPAWSYGAATPDIDRIAKTKDNHELEAAVDRLAKRVAKAQREYAQQAAFFKMRTSLQAASQVQAADTEEDVRSAQEEEAQREERERRRCAEEIALLLETLSAEVSPDDRTAIENRVEETVEAPQASRRRALLTQLRLDIQRANAATRERQHAVQQAEQWRERLLGLEGPGVEELDSELRQIVNDPGPLPPNMAQRVEDVVARATKATVVSNREYALGVLTEELESLGYVVEVGLEADSAEGSEMLLHKPGMEDDYHVSLYHVSLQAEVGAPLFHHRVVREASDPIDSDGPRSAARQRMDEQMERTWNQDLATALVAAEPRGIYGRAVERTEIGAVPVQTIAPLKRKSEPESEAESKPKSKPKRKRRRTGQLKSRVGR